ncbi:protein tyrosine phosphatase [Rouxiella silvae]|uniref:protein-tyrosine-phosphatase n=1 Tax=Rouxiella silvae TaxID=1646373 RepID=A0AA40X020_9GAMM|nr:MULTISPECIES: protein-tyrosine-phosphatase [Rouxiella]KAB7895192.1 protein tyrosine phosphatase [Rouxiella sp. S1S-2]KQN43708.1 protein tyrosine phosphatase [Serratia sp. Leaf50]MBF6636243.1 protein tyrosine phosphatase [Rouxiella silvae]ORJ18749.1 protein tyrosine phosphatase [Rouxiella silvae]
MFNSVLVICTGNICRSPTAERRLRQLLPGLKIDSAGVGALVGHQADEQASRTAEKYGLSLEGHSGRQFSAQLARQYDLILVMERSHVEQVTQQATEARGKTLLLGHWLNKKEIPDPYRQSQEAFEYVYQLIDQACQSWSKKLGG